MLGGLCLPLVQQLTKAVEVEPLSGAYNLPDTVPLTAKNWFNGRFQDLYTPYYEYEFGFRPSFIRLRNQLYYDIFNGSTSYVVLGKNNQLFAYNYWEAIQNFGFIGKDSIQARVNRLSQLKQKLDSLGVPMLVVIGANKVRYMPEYMPESLQHNTSPGNYDVWIPELQKAGLPFVDFNSVFLKMKTQMGKKMFPNSGTHWSAYGMVMCLDSILSFTRRYRPVRGLEITGYEKRDSILPSDVDLRNDLNLMCPPPTEKNLFAVSHIDTTHRKAKLFVIGDSFYWNLYQLDEFYQTVDSTSHFWYYNNSDINFIGAHTPVDKYNAIDIVKHSDAVIILATEANLHLMPYGFANGFLEDMESN